MIIALDGPDGAGKSTLVARAITWANKQGISIRVVGKWDILEPGVVQAARFLGGTTRDELRVCIAEMPSPARMMMLAWMNALAADRAGNATESLVILDGYWVKHAASEQILGCPPKLVAAVTDAIADVDAIIYVDVEPGEALRRKGDDITPYECGGDLRSRPASFLTHQRRMRMVMQYWAVEYGWPTIEADAPDAMERQLIDIIARMMRVSA